MKLGKMAKPDRIKAIIERKSGQISKIDIMAYCPDINQITVERTLTNLFNSGYIQKVGARPATAYIKIEQ